MSDLLSVVGGILTIGAASKSKVNHQRQYHLNHLPQYKIWFKIKGYKFISSRKQEKCTKANCMTTEAHFLEKMKKLDFKQCAERQYQQTLVAKNLCWVNRFFTCWLKILNYVLESLQFLSKYNWLLTNHADIALDVSHTKTNKHVSWFLFQTPH